MATSRSILKCVFAWKRSVAQATTATSGCRMDVRPVDVVKNVPRGDIVICECHAQKHISNRVFGQPFCVSHKIRNVFSRRVLGGMLPKWRPLDSCREVIHEQEGSCARIALRENFFELFRVRRYLWCSRVQVVSSKVRSNSCPRVFEFIGTQQREHLRDVCAASLLRLFLRGGHRARHHLSRHFLELFLCERIFTKFSGTFFDAHVRNIIGVGARELEGATFNRWMTTSALKSWVRLFKEVLSILCA